MYIYVRFAEPEQYYRHAPGGEVKARLEQVSGQRCLIVPYREMSMAVVEELSPAAIALGGFGGHLQSREVEWFSGVDEVLRRAQVPMICFCGSHQLMAFCCSRDIRKLKRLRDQPMRRLRPGEHWPRQPCTDPHYDLSSYFVAKGFLPIRRIRSDPIFQGLPGTMIMHCWHYGEVKKLPKDFVRLAESDHCRIEAMRHKTKPLYGVQFHPEAYAEPFLDGKKLLANFARIAERFWSARS